MRRADVIYGQCLIVLQHRCAGSQHAFSRARATLATLAAHAARHFLRHYFDGARQLAIRARDRAAADRPAASRPAGAPTRRRRASRQHDGDDAAVAKPLFLRDYNTSSRFSLVSNYFFSHARRLLLPSHTSAALRGDKMPDKRVSWRFLYRGNSATIYCSGTAMPAMAGRCQVDFAHAANGRSISMIRHAADRRSITPARAYSSPGHIAGILSSR